ncbi:hypothetical protein L083_6095 [Actinoplanes sp. N902-109]|nr:hypothetical protein L083_6095 [Actinoplanes sp. N902-109]
MVARVVVFRTLPNRAGGLWAVRRFPQPAATTTTASRAVRTLVTVPSPHKGRLPAIHLAPLAAAWNVER